MGEGAMNRKEKMRHVEHLLLCTFDAHTHYRQQVLHGETDLKWAEWYAEYLIGHGLDNLIGDRLEVEQIASFFEGIEKETHVKPVDNPWVRLAAAKMVRLSEPPLC